MKPCLTDPNPAFLHLGHGFQPSPWLFIYLDLLTSSESIWLIAFVPQISPFIHIFTLIIKMFCIAYFRNRLCKCHSVNIYPFNAVYL